MENTQELRKGGCACGAIRFEVNAPIIAIGACHCHKCQKASGGGPNYVALAPKGALNIVQGTPKVFEAKGDSGATVGRVFCGDCGTPLWSIPAYEPFTPVKLGALDDTAGLALDMHIFVESAPDWHNLNDDVPKFDTVPPTGAKG